MGCSLHPPWAGTAGTQTRHKQRDGKCTLSSTQAEAPRATLLLPCSSATGHRAFSISSPGQDCRSPSGVGGAKALRDPRGKAVACPLWGHKTRADLPPSGTQGPKRGILRAGGGAEDRSPRLREPRRLRPPLNRGRGWRREGERMGLSLPEAVWRSGHRDGEGVRKGPDPQGHRAGAKL